MQEAKKHWVFSAQFTLLTVDWSLPPQDKEDCPWHQLITPVFHLGMHNPPFHVESSIKTNCSVGLCGSESIGHRALTVVFGNQTVSRLNSNVEQTSFNVRQSKTKS